tara:strand:+ start:71 stop:574 length:504 start_codon:yes stop_codon:yes gene_type:complete
MKIFKIFIFVLYLLNPSYSYSDDKVAFINLDKVIKNSKEGIKLINNIEQLDKKNLKLLEQKQSKLKKFEDEINSKKNIISKEETLKDIEKLKNQIKLFNEEKNKMVSELNKFKKTELDKIMKRINPIIQNYMEENSIEILLDSKYIYIGSANSDLTQIITDKLNKTN